MAATTAARGGQAGGICLFALCLHLCAVTYSGIHLVCMHVLKIDRQNAHCSSTRACRFTRRDSYKNESQMYINYTHPHSLWYKQGS